MIKLKTNLIKISILVLIGILFINIILNNIVVYQSVSQDENTILLLVVSILGTILGLVVRSTLTFIFWYSYNTKYPDQKYNEGILKKLLASFLFLSICSIIPLGNGMPLVFITCTLVTMLKQNRKYYEEHTN